MAKKDSGKDTNTSEEKRRETEDNSSMLDTLLGGQVGSLLGGLLDISGQAAKMAAGTTVDQVLKLLKYSPEQLERMGRAGTALKDAREVAGLTLTELSSAIGLKNPDMLKTVEDGKAALPFEIILRLASFYARNDPVPFVMKYARTYSPGIWDVMQTLGLDKLTLEAEREIQFLNIYRSHDAARQLSDDGFERVHEFTQRAFEMALHFVAEQENIGLEEDEDENEEPAE
ncbi:MAG: XRE family transcriptional regulator [Gammaproteobacteria bacterium]|jgi:transcriptional regulator with XRE-family HTH domain|nr:XRE family transcriptional regulator [Gammaproteobacteria bacterium]